MCSYEHYINVDHTEGNSRLAHELEASKQSRLRAWSVLQRLRMVLSEVGSVAIPPPAKKTFDAEGEALEHALRKSFPSPQRCNQKSVFLGAPLSRCYHQGGMQRRLSARSSGVVESSRSGGGSDSELNHVTRVTPPKSENNPERIR